MPFGGCAVRLRLELEIHHTFSICVLPKLYPLRRASDRKYTSALSTAMQKLTGQSV
jgi:hypothetical protein